MKQFESVNDALDFAIDREQEAVEFYTDLSKKMRKPAMKDLFKGFAAEEKGHKAKLLAVKKGNFLKPSAKNVMDLKIADYLVDVPAEPGMEFQQALILAMKKEKAAFKLYTDLSAAAKGKELKETFLALAQEEAKHKLRFEIVYDEEILKEN